ncbi:MAG: DNA-binding protein [Deltaproteobacteria bacterium]|jgi:hypothetical protein|nr:DNA-binding protein [Deltaproteobacteria bacterium]
MSRPTSIINEILLKAIEDLTEEGENITLINLHNKLGGSLRTVNKFWQTWREETGYQKVVPLAVAGPDDDLKVRYEASLAKGIAAAQKEYAGSLAQRAEENRELDAKL